MDSEEIEIIAEASGEEQTGQREERYGGADINTSNVNVVNGEPDPVVNKTLTIGVFFDGTLNGRQNVMEDPNGYGGGATSYDASFTNVARAEKWYNNEDIDENNKIEKIYIEGSGVDVGEKDNARGFRIGSGPTGVIMDTLKACQEITEYVDEGQPLNLLIIDVFGFSRGATTARTFVNELTKRGGRYSDAISLHFAMHLRNNLPHFGLLGAVLEEYGKTIKQVRIRCVGIYDTVSSFQEGYLAGIPPYSFENDEEDLGLHAIDEAEVVVHLAASDEHRVMFSLTRIHKAKSKHVEFNLPGVHADIGGGYKNGDETWQLMDINNTWGVGRSEREINALLENDKKELIHQGYYELSDQDTKKLYIDIFNQLIGSRTALSNRYSYVTLQLMVEQCHRLLGQDIFNYEGLLSEFDISGEPFLGRVKQRLQRYINGTAPELKLNHFWELHIASPSDALMLRALRKKYVHISSRYGGVTNYFGYRPRWRIEGDKIVRYRRIYPNS